MSKVSTSDPTSEHKWLKLSANEEHAIEKEAHEECYGLKGCMYIEYVYNFMHMCCLRVYAYVNVYAYM